MMIPENNMELGGGRANLIETRSSGFWSRRTLFQRKLLIFLSVLGAICVLAVIVVVKVQADNASDGKIPDLEDSKKLTPITEDLARLSPIQVKEGTEYNDLSKDKVGNEKKKLQSEYIDLSKDKVGNKKKKLQSVSSHRHPFDICTTLQCVLSAAALLSAMDPTTDPCEDFFQFACGGWLQKNEIPESMYQWGQISAVTQQSREEIKRVVEKTKTKDEPIPLSAAKDMYTACMNTDLLDTIGLKPLTDLIAKTGGWPMVLDNWDSAKFDWQKVVAESRRRLGETWLYTIYVYLDHKDTNHSSIYIDESSLGLSRSFLTEPESYDAILKGYKEVMVKIAAAVRDDLGSDVTDEQIIKEVEDVFTFETELAKIITPAEARRNISNLYYPYLLPDLQQKTDAVQTNHDHAKVSWKRILNMIFDETEVTISDSERVIVPSPDYIGNFTQLLDRTEKRTIANYLNWRLVLSWAGETTQEMRDLLFLLQQTVIGVSAKTERWQRCVGMVESYLGMAISYDFIDSVFDEESKQLTLEMVNDLRAAFKEQVKKAVWMDEQTKTLAQEKADAMHELIGYPNWLKNKTALENYYEGVSLTADQHFQNLYKQRDQMCYSELKGLRDLTDRDDAWMFPPSTVNAAYVPNFNALMFPAGILQSPFFKKDRTAALNYGGIGSIIGHELTHGFDDQGRQFDKFGNIAQWWTEETTKAYKEKVQCFIDQYGNYKVPELVQFLGNEEEAKLNGVLTQGENIADNGGLRQAFQAYQKFVSEHGTESRLPGLVQYTPEHLFFLAFASNWCEKITDQGLLGQILTDPHSPAKYRVWGTVSNSEDFRKIWGCKDGQAMNSPNKCTLW